MTDNAAFLHPLLPRGASHYYAWPDFEASPGPVRDGIIRKLRPGNVLEVDSVDRLAFSFTDLKKVIAAVESKGAILRVARVGGSRDEPLLDRYRRDLKRAAVRRAKAHGSYRACTGRKRSLDYAAVGKLRDAGRSLDAIAAELKAPRSTVAYALKKLREAA